MDDPVDCEVDTIEAVLDLVSSRLTTADCDLILRAYRLAEIAHAPQKRSTGEPYITHPVAVAGILACHNLDAPTIAAALLHDTVEDTSITLDDVRKEFGDEVAALVDAVTKLKKREGESLQYRTDREAESLRKMMLGVANDIRVVLIKLADRLHNMRTLEALPPEKRRRIARETLEIFAPLANRLGIWEWKQQLEELGFRYAEPEQYSYISQMLEQSSAEREAALQRIINTVRESLAELGIHNPEITGRTKQIFSIWRKMQRKDRSFDQIMDVRAIRVIIEDGTQDAARAEETAPVNNNTPVEEIVQQLTAEAKKDRERPPAERSRTAQSLAVQQCYIALGVIHRLWTPIRGEFDDYIARPKDNHYQSLHTAVMADDGKTLEVQIRTRSMHRAAEFGIAAHWIYKEQSDISRDYQGYLDGVREAIKSLSLAEEDPTAFVSALKQDTAPKDTIFCFTPKGKALEMPVGATVLDFAYHIHTDLGNHCRGAKVNGVFEPLTRKLKNGDQVEVITRGNATPSRDWLHDSAYVVTASARGKIKQWFRKLDRDQNVAGGRELVEKELKRLGTSLKLPDVLALYKVGEGHEDEFFEKVGAGVLSTDGIIARVEEEGRRRDKEREQEPMGFLGSIANLRSRKNIERKSGWHVIGAYDIMGIPSSCCNPVPGDDVVGYVTRGQGIKVHRRDCKNLQNVETERMMEMSFSQAGEDVYPVQFVVTAAERPGLLSEVSSVFSEQRINLVDFGIVERDQKQGTVDLFFTAEVARTNEVGMLLNRMKLVKNVFDTRRVMGNFKKKAKN